MKAVAARLSWFRPLPFTLGLSAVIVGMVVWKLLPPPVDPRAERVAEYYGVDARNYERCVNLMDKSRTSVLTVEDYGFIVQQTKATNAHMRLAGFDALKWAAAKGPFRDQAIQELGAMKSDPDKVIHREYVWAMMIARAPGWQDIANQALNDPDPLVQEKAKSALVAGAKR